MAKSTDTRKIKAFIEWVNAAFPPVDKKYPVAFYRKEDRLGLITSECLAITSFDKEYGTEHIGSKVVDYYGEDHGGFAWIHPKIEEEAKARGLWLEWENAGAVCINVS